MISFETWFKDSFLYSFSPKGREEGSIDHEKAQTYMRWLFGSSLYLSLFSFFFYLIGLSSSHLGQLSDSWFIEKLLFFASPTAWRRYVLVEGGLFNCFRNSTSLGETIFIIALFCLIALSIVNLAIALMSINSSCKENLRELELVTYPLCFPGLGFVIAGGMIAHFQIIRHRKFLTEWIKTKPSIQPFMLRYFELIDKRDYKRSSFKPKTMAFLNKKEEARLTNKLEKLSQYVSRNLD
ncbi:hypothetical protein MHLP_00500 [Candidatus Mycoplasma haematolamae str. Purdue]|uniref:Transmembrane protein n=1 Tax=Mycoplasma haematolamae (strain Purdue) TaxID=1212765 RepID=I7B8W0_MYCHA|nr:hypothetical protein [Candidatus Mycoplasma haematolamae]AFO51680.1 hypothetical protein MHLP_00500 [Candidatus Mycoplasma haematolamae str. Purdue]